MRQSTVTSHTDSAGKYEVEVFDCHNPARVIICVHGNGARRWDGEKFFYEVAAHYADSAVYLVDQNQQLGNGVQLNPLPILVSRLQSIMADAGKLYPHVPQVIIAHSMGCGVASQLSLGSVASIFFIAPADGTPQTELVGKYGPDIVNGKTVMSTDGQKRIITAAYYESLKGITWEDKYTKLLTRYSPVYVYEADDDEILDDSRFAHRTLPFTSYDIIKAAKHNFSGQPLAELFDKMDKQLKLL